jgi:protoporphyrinogen IX oxidase
MGTLYEWLKIGHVISVICWMAGMFYLPRLYVYHAQVKIGSDEDIRFQTMERRLLRGIMNPSMIFTIIFGLALTHQLSGSLGMWYHIKMLMVVFMMIMHMAYAKWRKDFERGENKHNVRFYKIMNEIPPLLMVVAVILVIIKPS